MFFDKFLPFFFLVFDCSQFSGSGNPTSHTGIKRIHEETYLNGSGTFRHQPFGRQYGFGHLGDKSVDQMKRPASDAHLGRGTMPRKLKQETVVLLHT